MCVVRGGGWSERLLIMIFCRLGVFLVVLHDTVALVSLSLLPTTVISKTYMVKIKI